jgi:hypothetical protein
MSWHVARDHQTTLVEQWRHPDGIEYGLNFLAASERKAGVPQLGGTVADIEEPKIAAAEPIFVEPEVVDLIDHARQTFEPETLLAPDVLIPWGFAFFARPLYVLDEHGKKMGFRALAWAPYVKRPLPNHLLATTIVENPENATGLLISLYSHIDDEDDFAWKSPDRGFRRWPLWMAHWAHMSFGSTVEAQLSGAEFNNDLARQTTRDFYGFIQVFFRLMQQKIAVKHPEIPPRAVRKRSDRARLPERKVLVVTLRRASNPHRQEGEGFEYSHRFIVGGHWHAYWHGSGEDRYLRQHWVSDYVKGPDGAELIIKERAFDFTR